MLGNWVRQTCTTAGTGTLVLGAMVPGYIPFTSAFPDGRQIFYSIVDGDNRETGVGVFNSQGNTITRTYVLETLFNGTFNKGRGIPAISLSGASYVAVLDSTYAITNYAPVWREMHPTSGLTLLNTSPPQETIFIGGIKAYVFPDSGAAEIGFTFNVPHDVDIQSQFIPFVHWAPMAALTGNVRWGLEYSMARRDEQFAASTDVGIIAASSGVLNTAHHHECFEGDRIPQQPPQTIMAVKLYRDPTNGQDTFAGPAALFGVGMSYLSDRAGTPQRDPDFYAWL